MSLNDATMPSKKIALTYQEVEALGICGQRLLRRMVATGHVKRSVLRIGRRGIRFLTNILIEELQQSRD
jgi:hypothetical protein